MQPIVRVPNDVLTVQAKTVTLFDKRLRKLVGEMKKTLVATKNPKGVGLAAPQIGQSWRIFLTRPTEKTEIRVFINPVIIKRSEEKTDGVPERDPAKRDLAPPDNKLEGCLSIAGIWGRVRRASKIRLKFCDETGAMHEEEYSGLLATIIQHETDHTNGILYTKRVVEQKGKLYQTAKDKEGKEILEEIHI